MEYNDFDILMVLGMYTGPVALWEVLAQLTPGGEPTPGDYADGLWLAAALEQDGLVATDGQDENLSVWLTAKGRDLCERTADTVAASITRQWQSIQQLFSPAV